MISHEVSGSSSSSFQEAAPKRPMPCSTAVPARTQGRTWPHRGLATDDNGNPLLPAHGNAPATRPKPKSFGSGPRRMRPLLLSTVNDCLRNILSFTGRLLGALALALARQFGFKPDSAVGGRCCALASVLLPYPYNGPSVGLSTSRAHKSKD